MRERERRDQTYRIGICDKSFIFNVHEDCLPNIADSVVGIVYMLRRTVYTEAESSLSCGYHRSLARRFHSVSRHGGIWYYSLIGKSAVTTGTSLIHVNFYPRHKLHQSSPRRDPTSNLCRKQYPMLHSLNQYVWNTIMNQ